MQATDALPRVELHCHLDGIISPEMARDIRAEQPDFPIDPDELARAYPVTDLQSFFNWWGYITPLDHNLRLYYPIIERYIRQLKAQSVCYLELLVAIGDLPADPAAAVDTMQAFREWVTACEGGAVQVEFVGTFGRGQSAERFATLGMPKLLALHKAGLICGVSLAGPEINNPASRFASSFDTLHAAGLPLEIHAGEWVGPESVWDALQHAHPTRIGHGVSLFSDPRLVEYFQTSGMHIEFCPTSNVKTGSISRIEEHPVGRARDLGLNFSVNTDDPGVFGCSMDSEFALVTALFGFTQDDWAQVTHNSLASRFQPTLRPPNV